jgi:hypothetical protein
MASVSVGEKDSRPINVFDEGVGQCCAAPLVWTHVRAFPTPLGHLSANSFALPVSTAPRALENLRP